MRPADQTTRGADGDCFAACLASVLELPAGSVPNFIADLGDYPEGDEDGERDWHYRLFAAVNTWLAPAGLYFFEVATYPEPIPRDLLAVIPSGAVWIASGLGAAGLEHAVVMRGREMAHDPSPSRAGLLEVYAIGLLIALDPVLSVPLVAR